MSFSDKEKLLKMSRNIIMNKILSASVRLYSKYRRKFSNREFRLCIEVDNTSMQLPLKQQKQNSENTIYARCGKLLNLINFQKKFILNQENDILYTAD